MIIEDPLGSCCSSSPDKNQWGLDQGIGSEIVKSGEILNELEGRAQKFCRTWDIRERGEGCQGFWPKKHLGTY